MPYITKFRAHLGNLKCLSSRSLIVKCYGFYCRNIGRTTPPQLVEVSLRNWGRNDFGGVWTVRKKGKLFLYTGWPILIIQIFLLLAYNLFNLNISIRMKSFQFFFYIFIFFKIEIILFWNYLILDPKSKEMGGFLVKIRKLAGEPSRAKRQTHTWH